MRPAKTPELAYPVSIAEDGTRRAVTINPHIGKAMSWLPLELCHILGIVGADVLLDS